MSSEKPIDLLRKHKVTAEVQAALDYLKFSMESEMSKLVAATAPSDIKRTQGRCQAYRDLICEIVSSKHEETE